MNSLTHTRRRFANAFFLTACTFSALLAVAVLLIILGYIFVNGISYINPDFFTSLPQPLGEPGGGVGNSIVGSLIVVGIGATMAIPVGIGAGVFVSEYAGRRVGDVVRFTADVLTGVPSIVVGVVVYGLVVLRMGHFSGLAAGIALAVIMLPIMARSAEEMMRLVPQSQREASLALGIPRWRTVLSVVIPAAQRGLVTAALLAIARGAGETAPLIFTALGNRFWAVDPTSGPVDALPLRIWRYGTGPYDEWHQQAWAASFVLVLMVFSVSVIARLALARRR